MFILKAIICFFVLIFVPEILGMLITKFMKEKNILLSFLIGYIIEFSVLQIIAVPMILLKLMYQVLLYSWSSIIAVLCITSIILNAKEIKKNIVDFIKNFNIGKIFNKTNILPLVVFVLITTQIVLSIIYTHNDADDAFYLGTTVNTLYEKKMYRVSPENGYYYEKIPARYALAPFPMYVALISSITDIHPVIIAHSVLQPLFIFLTYVVYILIAQKIFKDNKNDISLFLIFLNLIFMFGNISTRTNFTVMYLRIWQGKAILASIILPSLWLVFSLCKENDSFINWFTMLLIIVSACLTSEMGLALAPLSLMLLSFIFSLKDKKWTYILKSMLCIIPSLVYLIIYMFIK